MPGCDGQQCGAHGLLDQTGGEDRRSTNAGGKVGSDGGGGCGGLDIEKEKEMNPPEEKYGSG